METKHTPGPWQVGPVFDNDGAPEIIVEHITPSGNLVVAVALGGLQGQEANARLISAAPELLKEGQAMRTIFATILEAADIDADTTEFNIKADGKTVKTVTLSEIFARMDAAIAKATGGAE